MTEPQQNSEHSLSKSEPEYAGFWIRFLAMFLDTLCIMIIWNLIFITCFFLARGNIGSITAVLQALKPYVKGLELLYFILGWLCQALLESSAWQATPGKKICGLRVTDLSGCKLTFKRASIRCWAQLISGVPCWVGYFMVVFTEKKQALHDIIAGTLVVKAD